MKKSLSLILAVVFVMLFLYGSTYFTEAVQYWENRFSNQEVSLEHRTRTNAFAQYGSAVVFAPFSLIAPFPTLVNIENQQNHMLLAGAFYIKNILAFFTLSALVMLIKSGRWREHVLILSILLSYVAMLSLSKFALVERFHFPGLPFYIILIAYGISIAGKPTFRYYSYYLVFIAAIIIGWNWFKLAGRGLL